MKYNIEKLQNKNLQLKLELDSKEWEALVEDSYNKTKGKYKVEGLEMEKHQEK